MTKLTGSNTVQTADYVRQIRFTIQQYLQVLTFLCDGTCREILNLIGRLGPTSHPRVNLLPSSATTFPSRQHFEDAASSDSAADALEAICLAKFMAATSPPLNHATRSQRLGRCCRPRIPPDTATSRASSGVWEILLRGRGQYPHLWRTVERIGVASAKLDIFGQDNPCGSHLERHRKKSDILFKSNLASDFGAP